MIWSLSFLGPPLVAALLAYGLAPLAGRLAVRIGAVDHPGPRKVHDHPIPRLGGLSVLLAIGLTWAMRGALWGPSSLPPELLFGLVVGLVPVVAVSIADDIRSLNPGLKLLGHLFGALIAVGSGISLGSEVTLLGVGIPIGMLAVPLSVAWIVGLTNAFNLIDGLDGLSSGLALIASATLGAVFLMMDQPGLAASTLVLAGALSGFLPYNLSTPQDSFSVTRVRRPSGSFWPSSRSKEASPYPVGSRC